MGRKQIVEQGLQAAFAGAQKKRNQNRKGKLALTSKRFVVGSMRGNEVGRMEKFCKAGENTGLNTAQSVASIYPFILMGYRTYYTTSSLA
ncbi:MAG: hypothetical protein ACRER2_07625 [Methylococcales bacterium]